MTDDESVTVIGGHRYADDFIAIWRDLTIGRIKRSSGAPPNGLSRHV